MDERTPLTKSPVSPKPFARTMSTSECNCEGINTRPVSPGRQAALRAAPLVVKPAMQLCGHRLRVASDDFVVTRTPAILLQILWTATATILLVALFAREDGGDSGSLGSCDAGDAGTAFATMWAGVAWIALFVDIALISISLCGSISNDRPRRLATPFFAASLVFDCLQAFVFIFGMVVVFRGYIDCDEEDADTTWDLLKASLIIGIVAIAGRLQREMSGPSTAPQYANWKNIIRLMCCCAKRSERRVWQDLGSLFSIVFGDEEYTATDLAVGIRLVNKYHHYVRQRRRAEAGRERYAEAPWGARKTMRVLETPHDFAYLKELLDVLPFALGAFGWPLYCFMKSPCVGACQLACSTSRACCCNPRVTGDWFCRCHSGAFILSSKVAGEDLLYGNLNNYVCHPHMYVAAHHASKALIVSVRGTLSISDVVTDTLARVEDAHIHALPNVRLRAHAGIWKAASNLCEHLIDEGVLARILQDHPELRGYRLITTGQSLGSAVASAMSLQLQGRVPEGISQVHAYAFSPAPILGENKEALAFAEKHITGVTLGNDMIARLSLVNLRRLKALVRVALSRSQDTKCRALCGCGFLGVCCPLRHEWWEDFDEDRDLDLSTAVPAMEERLCVPGLLIHLVKRQETYKRLFRASKRDYKAYYTTWENLDCMWVNPRMALDHMPDTLYYKLKDLVKEMEDVGLEAPTVNDAGEPVEENQPRRSTAQLDQYSEV